jgi:hypothetical protein
MKRSLTLTAALLAAATFGGLATAASGWHVFATGQDAGDYGAYASASASASKPHGLAVRATAEADINWSLSCDGTTHVPANTLVVLSVGAAGSCRAYGSASTNQAGTVKIQLLRR